MSIGGGAVPNTLLAVYCCMVVATVVVCISLIPRLRFNVESGGGRELMLLRYLVKAVVRIWRGGSGSCVRCEFGKHICVCLHW